MDRSWSLSLPACGTCVRGAVKIGVKLDVVTEAGTYGRVDPEAT